MDYGHLIGEAWRIAWRHRWLWVFGFFAAGTGGTGVNCSWVLNAPGAGQPWQPPEISPEFERPLVDAGTWLLANLGLLVVGGCVALLFIFAFFVLSLISQGALVAAAARIDRGEAVRFADAWRAGLSTFWRFLGLNVVRPVAGGLVAAVFIPAGALFIAGLSQGGNLGGLLIVFGVLAGLVALVIAVPLWIAIWVVFTFAMRAVAVDGHRFAESIGRGFELLRLQFRTSLMLWLISLGLTFAGGLAVLILLAIPAIPLGGLALVLLLTLGLSPISLAVLALVALVLIVVVAVLNGALNSFLWSYWTLAYLRLAP